MKEIRSQSWYTGAPIYVRYAAGGFFIGVAGLLLAAAFFTPVPVAFIFGALLFILIAIAVGCFEKLTLKEGRDGEPVLVQMRYKCYCPAKKLTFKLAKYKSMAIDNALGRHRESHVGSLLLFILSGGWLSWVGLDSGMKAGKWQLKLDLRTVFQDDSLEKVKELANAIKKSAGIRVGR